MMHWLRTHRSALVLHRRDFDDDAPVARPPQSTAVHWYFTRIQVDFPAGVDRLTSDDIVKLQCNLTFVHDMYALVHNK